MEWGRVGGWERERENKHLCGCVSMLVRDCCSLKQASVMHLGTGVPKYSMRARSLLFQIETFGSEVFG